jgi:hypothetical protein
MIPQVAPVASEQFVATHAGEDDCYVAARKLRDEVSRYECRIGDRLVHMPEQARKEPDDIRSHDDFVVLRTEQIGHPTRVRQLIVKIISRASLEPDCIRPYRTVTVGRHQTDHRTGINTAGQEGADRHVAHHFHAHSLVEACAHAFDPFSFARFPIDP